MSAYLSLIGRRRGGRLFEVGRLLVFSPFRMGAYSKWALIRGWALVRINTVNGKLPGFPCMVRLTEVIPRGDSYLMFTVSLHFLTQWRFSH